MTDSRADNILSTISTEPRHIPTLTLLGHDDTNGENYTHESSRELWQTSIPQQDDLVRGVDSLVLSDGTPWVVGTHDEVTKSYDENSKVLRDHDGRSFAARTAARLTKRLAEEHVRAQDGGHAVGAGMLPQSTQSAIGDAVVLRQANKSITTGPKKALPQLQSIAKPVRRPVAESTTLGNTPRSVHRSFSENALHDGLFLKIGDWADEWLQRHVPPFSEHSILLIAPSSLPEYRSLNLQSLDAVVQCPSGSSSSSRAPQSQSSQPSNESRGGRRGGAGRGVGKRTTNDRDINDNNGGDGNRNDPKRPKSDPPQSPRSTKWFACHFHKHDPEYFSTNETTRMQYKSCGAGGWTEIARLK